VKVVVNSSGSLIFLPAHDSLSARCANRSDDEQLAAFPFLKTFGHFTVIGADLAAAGEIPVSPLERAERLEQLRALENGIQRRGERALRQRGGDVRKDCGTGGRL